MSKFYISEHLNSPEVTEYYELELKHSSSASELERHMLAVRIGELFDIAWNRYQNEPEDRMFLVGMPEEYPCADYYDTHDRWQD